MGGREGKGCGGERVKNRKENRGENRGGVWDAI